MPTCGIEKLVCRNHVFAQFFKQASVKASTFDVIGNFIVDPSTFYRGVTIVFPLQPCRIEKDFYFSRTSALVVIFSSSQNRSASLMSPEWIYLTKTSNWTHEVTSVDSSTWKKHCSWRCFYFIYHLVFHIFRHIWNAPLNSIAGRPFHLMCASLPSPRSYFTVFNKQEFTSVFSNRASFFAWQFQVRLHMMPVFLGETSSKIVWRFKLASWRRKNSITFVAWLGCFVSKCRINFEGFTYFLALRAFISLQYASS